jgi:hypothetical protein
MTEADRGGKIVKISGTVYESSALPLSYSGIISTETNSRILCRAPKHGQAVSPLTQNQRPQAPESSSPFPGKRAALNCPLPEAQLEIAGDFHLYEIRPLRYTGQCGPHARGSTTDCTDCTDDTDEDGKRKSVKSVVKKNRAT